MHVSLRAVTNLNAAMHPGSSVLLRLWLTMSSHLGLYELHCVHTVTELPKIHFFFFFGVFSCLVVIYFLHGIMTG